MFTNTKYYKIVGSWYGQNVGEHCHQLKNIQGYLNNVFKFQNIQEYLGMRIKYRKNTLLVTEKDVICNRKTLQFLESWTYHNFVKHRSRALVHLIKLVNTTHTVVTKHQRTAANTRQHGQHTTNTLETDCRTTNGLLK